MASCTSPANLHTGAASSMASTIPRRSFTTSIATGRTPTGSSTSVRCIWPRRSIGALHPDRRPAAMSSDPDPKRSLVCPQQHPDVLQATLDDEILVYYPDGTTAFALNNTASVIWELCNGERRVADIVEILQEAYPEAAATMPQEVDEAILALLSCGVIRVPRVGASAATYDVGLGGATVRLEADDADAARILDFLCAPAALPAAGAPSATFRLGTASGAMAVYCDDAML